MRWEGALRPGPILTYRAQFGFVTVNTQLRLSSLKALTAVFRLDSILHPFRALNACLFLSRYRALGGDQDQNGLLHRASFKVLYEHQEGYAWLMWVSVCINDIPGHSNLPGHAYICPDEPTRPAPYTCKQATGLIALELIKRL
ncbi:hypothetical protein VNO77_03368 [Canavalia gladiata]|uniref:Uncharacterized protein n=1 Tax=Canavalia gladiata TaxID=3824 RepID=A0AAN9MZK3_CANGL